MFFFQMGSTMKRSVFDDQTSKALKNWHKNAKKKSETPGQTQPPLPNLRPKTGGDIESASPANITASVDVKESDQSQSRDLLSGP